MLTRLQVRNYVLIDSLDVDFPEGLIIITGQTGAGKSILLGALSLIMGAKADAGMISDGADNCVVEAEFDVDPSDAPLKAELEENDVEWDEGHLIVRRVVNRSGRSRAFVNDSPVSVQVLQSISSRLVDIHSQHQTLLLSDRQFQLDILDHYAGNIALREQCADLWRRMGKIKADLAALDAKISSISSERDYTEARFRQLEEAGLREGELLELEEEQKQLANAEEIKTCLSYTEELFCPTSGDASSLDSILKEASRQLSKAGRFITSVQELSERVDSCRRELDDILSDVSSANSRVDVSESRLEIVESRMSLIYSLMQKFSCRDEAELIAQRESLSEQLFDSTQLEEKRSQMQSQLDALTAEHTDVADRLNASRMEASASFAESIQNSIRDMELPYSVFEVEILPAPLSAAGRDSVAFRFSSTGKNPVDVAKCASGGEMSRIMLALKAMMARYANMPTMIFDEIDTGVSGSVADRMGSVICAMGEYMQVFAITHLPQVAAKGSAHYLVSKYIDPATSLAESKIERLSDEQRVLEVARMLSGSVLTDEAVANAKSLLRS
jgi:DNA repair protein RecN (Recombination protein N)